MTIYKQRKTPSLTFIHETIYGGGKKILPCKYVWLHYIEVRMPMYIKKLTRMVTWYKL